jgi:hypothetical protein
MNEPTKVWGELWQGRTGPDSPKVPHRQVGDLVPIPARRYAYDPPSSVYRVTEVIGEADEAEYRRDPTTARHPDYCYFRGELVEGFPVQAEVVEPLERTDSALGDHLGRLNAGD